MQGRGASTYADGTSYVGEWRADARHAHGVLTTADGSSYVGEWSGGERHGHGTQAAAAALQQANTDTDSPRTPAKRTHPPT